MGNTGWRRRMKWGAAVAGVALLVGCGSPADPTAPGAAPAQAVTAQIDPVALARDSAEATQDAGSARFTMTATTETTADGAAGQIPTVAIESEGVLDFAARTADITTVIGSADGAASGGLPEMQTRTLLLGDSIYLQIPGMDGWNRVDPAQLGVTPDQQQNPAQQLDMLRAVSDDVQEAGTAEVRGEQTRRFTATIDPQRLAGTGAVPAQAEQMLAALEPFPVELYLDDDGLVRRYDFTMTISGAAMAGAAPELAADPAVAAQLESLTSTTEASMEFFDFGVPVEVTEPDPATVTEGLPGMGAMGGAPGQAPTGS